MNDFFLAKNVVLTLTHDNQNFEVRQVQVKDLDVWLSVAEQVKGLISTKNYSDEFLQSVFEQLPIQCLQLVAVVTDIPESLMFDCIMSALKLVLIANEAFFHEPSEKPRRGENRRSNKKDESSWFELFQLLVRFGHSHESIMNMSYGAFLGYLRAVEKRNAVERGMALASMRMAYHSKSEDYEKFAKSMGFNQQ